jgi:predicted small secreted protein
MPCESVSAMNPILLFDTFVCRVSEQQRLRLRTLLIAMLLGSLTIGLSSCATARGFGRDVETAGEKIEEAATR